MKVAPKRVVTKDMNLPELLRHTGKRRSKPFTSLRGRNEAPSFTHERQDGGKAEFSADDEVNLLQSALQTPNPRVSATHHRKPNQYG